MSHPGAGIRSPFIDGGLYPGFINTSASRLAISNDSGGVISFLTRVSAGTYGYGELSFVWMENDQSAQDVGFAIGSEMNLTNAGVISNHDFYLYDYAGLGYHMTIEASTGRFQFGAGLTWDGQMTVTCRDAARTVMVVKQAAAQSANSIEVKKSNNGVLWGVTALGNTDFYRLSSTTEGRKVAGIVADYLDNTDATRKGRGRLYATDAAADRLALEWSTSGSAPTIGFLGATAVARTAAYTPTNVTTDRSWDCNATTVDEVADVLATLVQDLQSFGLLG